MNAGETPLDINWPFRYRLGLALEGMAAWHLILTLSFTTLILVLAVAFALLALAIGGHPEAVLWMIGINLGVIVFGFIWSGVLSRVSYAVLNRSFRRRDWQLVCWPGALGTTVAIVGFIVWPISATIGAFVAHKMIDGKLRKGIERYAT